MTKGLGVRLKIDGSFMLYCDLPAIAQGGKRAYEGVYESRGQSEP